jgi:hypothetical protein
LAAIWDQRLADAMRGAEDGLLYVPAGMGAARLHAIHARALAAGGDAVAARAAMTAAEKAAARPLLPRFRHPPSARTETRRFQRSQHSPRTAGRALMLPFQPTDRCGWLFMRRRHLRRVFC